jgi:hypothetical protein
MRSAKERRVTQVLGPAVALGYFAMMVGVSCTSTLVLLKRSRRRWIAGDKKANLQSSPRCNGKSWHLSVPPTHAILETHLGQGEEKLHR